MYQAGSWKYPRRVVCKVEKPEGQLIHMYTFILILDVQASNVKEVLILFQMLRLEFLHMQVLLSMIFHMAHTKQ